MPLHSAGSPYPKNPNPNLTVTLVLVLVLILTLTLTNAEVFPRPRGRRRGQSHWGRKNPWRYFTEVWGLSCEGGAGGKRALLPWGPLRYTSRRREVRAAMAVWRLKEEENRKQVNLSLLKNTSCRKFVKFIKVLLYGIFFRLQLTTLSCFQSSWCK